MTHTKQIKRLTVKHIKMKQTKPFCVIIPDAFKRSLQVDALKTGSHYGIFFSTSGKAMIERINDNAQYGYIWRSDRDPA